MRRTRPSQRPRAGPCSRVRRAYPSVARPSCRGSPGYGRARVACAAMSGYLDAAAGLPLHPAARAALLGGPRRRLGRPGQAVRAPAGAPGSCSTARGEAVARGARRAAGRGRASRPRGRRPRTSACSGRPAGGPATGDAPRALGGRALLRAGRRRLHRGAGHGGRGRPAGPGRRRGVRRGAAARHGAGLPDQRLARGRHACSRSRRSPRACARGRGAAARRRRADRRPRRRCRPAGRC